jgi:Asp-tRNA(Asn)/Glu-tRNA(Gln) amidotransferase C subunit
MTRKLLENGDLATLAKFVKLDLSPERLAVLGPTLDTFIGQFDVLDEVDIGETPPTNSFDARWRS